MVVEPRLDRLELLLAEAVHGHQVILGLQEPGEVLLRVPGPGQEVPDPLVTLSSLHHSMNYASTGLNILNILKQG